MKPTILISFLMLIILIGSANALVAPDLLHLNGFSKGWIKGYDLISVTYSGAPTECLLVNSWVSKWGMTNNTCRTINYTAFVTILPTTNNTYSLGSAAFVWAQIFTNALVVNGQSTLIGDVVFDGSTMIYNATTNKLQGSFYINTSANITADAVYDSMNITYYIQMHGTSNLNIVNAVTVNATTLTTTNLTIIPASGSNQSIITVKGNGVGNACSGNATLSSGVVAVTTACASGSYIVLITPITTAGTPGFTYVKKFAGSFNITGIATDTSVYDWMIIRTN